MISVKAYLRSFYLESGDKKVRRVVVDMQSYLFSDAVSRVLGDADSDFYVYKSESPDKTTELCDLCKPHILLMEVSGHILWSMEERMTIREEVKQKNPQCKIVLIVDEKADKKLAQRVLQAKKDGLIDQFIYGSVSASYLLAVVDTV